MNKKDKKNAKNRIEYVLNLISPKKTDIILNIGVSNIPEIELALENKVKECITIDNDKVKIEKAQRYLKKAKILYADVTKKPFKKKYFDTVIMLEVLEHLEDDSSALKWIYSILKKGGKLILAVPNDDILHLINPVKYTQHYRHYSDKQIKKVIEETGFKVTHLNRVECWTLLANLYVHIFFKFILRRQIKFNTFNKKANDTYTRQNKSGMDTIVCAVKD